MAHLRGSGTAFASAATSATGTAGALASMSFEDTLGSSRIGISDGRLLGSMDGVSGAGRWQAVNIGCIGNGHQLAIAWPS